jgi:hypothetical protein
MYLHSEIELGTAPEEIRRIEAIVGTASTEWIEAMLKAKPDATLLEVYLMLANKQNIKRLGNA